jgi:hypothetical protein
MENKLIPITREKLKSLRIMRERELFDKKLNKSIKEVYNQIIIIAKISDKTSYTFDYGNLIYEENDDKYYEDNFQDNFYNDNIHLILEGLKLLFPDCLLTHGYKVISNKIKYPYITIDWS